MKKVFVLVLTMFVCVGLFAQEQTVAVTPFEIMSGVKVTPDEAEVIYELFITELSNVAGIKVVDRNVFNRITEQMHFQLSDWSDKNKVLEYGNALNATSIIRGQIMSLGGRMIVNTRIVDVNTTEILSAAPLQLADIVELLDKLPEYVKSVVGNLPKPGLKIGDTGPGGGIIFFAENGRFMEVTMDLGSGNYDAAERIVRGHRGGNFTDWRLPTLGEFRIMNDNLYKNNLGGFSGYYWSITDGNYDSISKGYNKTQYTFTYNSFINGYRSTNAIIRAVRSFNQ